MFDKLIKAVVDGPAGPSMAEPLFLRTNIKIVYHFKKITVRYKKVGYNIDVLRQTACLVVNPIKINSFAYLFNCTTVGRASD